MKGEDTPHLAAHCTQESLQEKTLIAVFQSQYPQQFKSSYCIQL